MERIKHEAYNLESSQLEIEAQLALQALHTLKQKNLTIALAESCTGGLLSFYFTMLSGASDILRGTMVCYSNAMKRQWLGVDEEILRTHGAVSEEVVRAMCQGILSSSGADIAIATSGIAGPSGGSPHKPVGSVYIAIQSKGEAAHVNFCHFQGNRHSVQMAACTKAINMLESLLLDK